MTHMNGRDDSRLGGERSGERSGERLGEMREKYQ